MDSVQLEFSIVPDHPKVLDTPLVGLGDFEAKHPGSAVYKNPPLLSSLWLDMILGRPLPTKMVLREVKGFEQLFCLALFMDRELALHPKVPAMVSSIELSSHLQMVGLAHIEPDLARLLIFLDSYLFSDSGSRKEYSRKLQQSLLWIREYTLSGKLPSMPRPQDPPRILDYGTNGFVLAEIKGEFLEPLLEIYRQGYLRGVLFGPENDDGHPVLCFKKSTHLRYDLEKALVTLNQAEVQVGRPPNWQLKNLLLYNEATRLPRDLITEIMLRV